MKLKTLVVLMLGISSTYAMAQTEPILSSVYSKPMDNGQHHCEGNFIKFNALHKDLGQGKLDTQCHFSGKWVIFDQAAGHKHLRAIYYNKKVVGEFHAVSLQALSTDVYEFNFTVDNNVSNFNQNKVK